MNVILISFGLFVFFGGVLYISQRKGHSCGCGQKNSACGKCGRPEK